MMLAKRENLNVLDNDELVVVLVKHRPVDNVPNVLFVALCKIQHCLGISFRRAADAFSVRVFTDTLQNGSHRA